MIKNNFLDNNYKYFLKIIIIKNNLSIHNNHNNNNNKNNLKKN